MPTDLVNSSLITRNRMLVEKNEIQYQLSQLKIEIVSHNLIPQL